MEKTVLQEKGKIRQELDRLLNGLVNLAGGVCGYGGYERDGQIGGADMDIHRTLLEGLAAAAEEDDIDRNSRLAGENAGDCRKANLRRKRSEAARLRRLERLNRQIREKQKDGKEVFDLRNWQRERPDIRSLKGEILANGRKAAAFAWSAYENGIWDERVCLEFYPALWALAAFDVREELIPVLKKSEKLLKACRTLEERGREKKLHERFMAEAIRQAGKAEALGEVPIGCVIVRDGQIVGRGYNRRTTDKDVLAHAEIIAMHRACRKLGDWRLEGCTLYVTLEPCPMCAGAMVQSRLDACVIGSMSDKSGCAGSVVNLLEEKGFNHQVRVVSGVLQEECSGMLSSFFGNMRRERQK